MRDEDGVDGNVQTQSDDSQGKKWSVPVDGHAGVAEDGLERRQRHRQEENGEWGRSEDELRSPQGEHGILSEDNPTGGDENTDAVGQVARPVDQTLSTVLRGVDQRREKGLHQEDGN